VAGTEKAVRAAGVGDVVAVQDSARELGVLGWVRHDDDGVVRVHAEGPGEAVDEVVTLLGEGAEVERVKREGHEQFAIRGVPAGRFVVEEQTEPQHRFVLGLEVDGAMRTWTVPKGPSLDPAAKRFAVEGGDLAGGAVWDEGAYEQGGRVPWPDAINRGHAVFVLHGTTLRGGFALQRTRSGWLLVKRRDEHARAEPKG
jgi:acylphosphatase